jgi:hypothetical protein
LIAAEELEHLSNAPAGWAGYAHALALLRYSGQALVLPNGGNGRFGLARSVPGLETRDVRRHPVAAVVGPGLAPAFTLAIATQHPPELLVWRRGTPSEPELVLVERIRLGFHVAGVAGMAPAPARCRGLLVAQEDRGRVYLVQRGASEPLVRAILDLGRHSVRLAAVADGVGMAAAVGGHSVMLFR